MWQILGVAVFCGLLSPSVGTTPGIRAVFSITQFTQALTDTLNRDNLLEKNMKNLPISDFAFGGLLGILAKITDFKCVGVRNIVLTVAISDEKVNVKFSADLDISGHLVIPLDAIVSCIAHVNIDLSYALGNFVDGKFDIVNFQCVPTIEKIELVLLSGLLPILPVSAIKNSLSSDLVQQLCSVVRTVIDVVKNIWLGTANVVLPHGNIGNVHLKIAVMPTVADTFVGVDLFFRLHVSVTGLFIDIPETAASIAVPVLGSYWFCISIHPAVISIAVSVAIPQVPLEVSNIPAVFSKAEELKSALLAIIPAGALPELATGDISFEITIGKDALVAFDTTGGTVTLSAVVGIFAKKADGSKVSLVVVRCRITAKLTISVINNQLNLRLMLSDNVIELVSSGIGVTQLGSLLDPITTLVEEAVLTALNERPSDLQVKADADLSGIQQDAKHLHQCFIDLT
ncbi:uncharacterized protein [Anolis sagrei]|uniref:uncharacterized protein n=1 Tax=Anolis sagrei TaxID=38937 RepID=UPI003520D566